MRERIGLTQARLDVAFGILAIVAVTALVYFRHERSRLEAHDAIHDLVSATSFDLYKIPTMGSTASHVVIIEFSDYQCAYCALYSRSISRALMERYVSTGVIRYGVASYPLPSHPMSKYLATAAGCANDQGQFWNMHDALFTKQPKSKAAVVSVAASLGLDVNKFMTCMDNSQAMMALIKRNIGIGRDLKLNGTPAFVLAVINPDGSALPKKYILGAQPLRVFDVAIADLRAR